jgi:predicted dehydrogenase
MKQLSRRKFIQQTSLTAAGVFFIGGNGLFGKGKSPNEKLNVGIIGTGNRALSNIDGVRTENIVALCDVDSNFLDAAAKSFPAATKYADFRKMLDRKDIDAVVISTPDHTHAIAAFDALDTGRHVYCEKPLTRMLSECRIVMKKAARNKKLATQLGTQIHATDNYRRVVELVQAGAIGTVKEVHVWVTSVYTAPGRPTETTPVPSNLNWDLWLGPVPFEPFYYEYHPKWWRRYWAFGGGTLGDMGCHHMDLPHWALNLRTPVSVEAEGPAVNDFATSEWMIVRYEYPARGTEPPVKLTWYHGERGGKPVLPPHFVEGKLPEWGNGTLFVGEKGMLLADYGHHLLLPKENFTGYVRPSPTIPRSIGHYEEWIKACKTGSPTTCSFEYGGALTESVLLGNVAYRTGKKIIWDSKRLRAKGCPEAEQFIEHEYRKGWRI